ncbi:MAG TPA: class I SAM-dependent methyltransferase [Thermoanaerobaculia bacterium]|nr:class I SAM-dependent methyltransferase [Thermoanaerobaculia bacterium]
MSAVERIRAYYEAILPFYEASLQDRGDLPFWESIASRWRSPRILELGCGTGRVTAVLSRHGTVTAADLLVEMVARAKATVPEARLLAADLRTLELGSRFDLVVLANDPMSHLTSEKDRAAAAERIARHVAPGGHVVIEGLYRPLRGGRSRVTRHVGREVGAFTVEERWTPEGRGPNFTATYRFADASRVVEVTSKLRAWTLEDVELLRQAGLRVEKLSGNFDERPFTRASARMLIFATGDGR